MQCNADPSRHRPGAWLRRRCRYHANSRRSQPFAGELASAFAGPELQRPYPVELITPYRPTRRVAPVDQITGPPLHLVEDQAHVLANHTKKEQLDAAEEAQGRDQGWPARHFGPPKGVEQQLGKAG